jgi:integrase
MARTRHRLSATAVSTLKAAGYHADGANLYFRVAPGGSRGWILRYALHGKTRDMGLGSYPDISLATARKLASKYRVLLEQHIDPINHRGEERAAERVKLATAMTFDDCRKAYIAAHEAGWSNAVHRKQWTSTLESYVTPVFGNLPVSAVDTGLVMKVVQPMWATKGETASRLRGRIEAILDWAKVNNRRTGENPARWRGHLDKLLPQKTKVRRVQHLAALPYDRIGDFLVDLRTHTSNSAKALELLILTATRSGEVRGATWNEIDLGRQQWTIPAARMKARKEHIVPLSAPAIALLNGMLRENEFVFPGGRQGMPMRATALEMLLHRMGRDDFTVHGFRSTFRDWAAERTNYPNHVVEMALAHTIPNAVEAAYRRGDLLEQRRKLMADWADYCAMPSISADKKVVPIAARLKGTSRLMMI